MKRPPPDNVISLPEQPITLADVLAELRAQRQLLEQLIAQPQPARAWVTVSEAARMVFRSEAARIFYRRQVT